MIRLFTLVCTRKHAARLFLIRVRSAPTTGSKDGAQQNAFLTQTLEDKVVAQSPHCLSEQQW